MAVENKLTPPEKEQQSIPPTPTDSNVGEFYAKHKLISTLTVIVAQCAGVAIIATALYFLQDILTYPDLFWASLAVILVVTIIINLIVARVIIEPLRAISAAIAHVRGEKMIDTPPNPNQKKYEKNGTNQLIDTLYNLHDGKPANSTPSTPNIIDSALQRTLASVVVIDNKNTITYHSARAPIREDSKGKKVLDIVFDNGDMTLKQWIAQCRKDTITAERIWTRVHTLPGGNSPLRIFDVAATFSRDSSSEITLVLHDRTKDYEPEEKDLDFIAFAAHELRGPITVIRGYLDVLADDLEENMTDEQRLLLGRLVVSANRLTTYVNNILNVSRYDRRHYRIEMTRQDLYTIYDSIADDMRSRATAQNRILQVDISPDLPAIAADPSSISEVFANLIDNAIKYSNEGGVIEISAAVSGNFVEVSIRDHGIGMPDSVVHNLFRKFYRSHRSRESVAGSGIGLYISKAIVDSHGGSIGVKSSEDNGSTFTFSLPIYESVEEKLKSSDNGNNEAMIRRGKSWISNHNMYRG